MAELIRPLLLQDVDTGPHTLGLPPGEVLPVLTAAGRSPLDIFLD